MKQMKHGSKNGFKITLKITDKVRVKTYDRSPMCTAKDKRNHCFLQPKQNVYLVLTKELYKILRNTKY